jgi:LCP family protein required for cell wall assembly
MSNDSPRYRRYRGRPGGNSQPGEDPLGELRQLRRSEAAGPPPPPGAAKPPAGGGRQPIAPRRQLRPPRTLGRKLLRWALIGASAWIALSLVVFLISAQLHQANVDPSALAARGTPPFSRSTILVIGSDRRPDDSQEAGAQTSGYGLADSIMLLRVGGIGDTKKLSIARDTIVPIPGRGSGKINSAYAYGGPELLAQTITGYTGLKIDHVMQVGFSDFAPLIDSMGGITYRGSCVISKVNGGYANGGVTLRIRTGEKVHLNGRQALALARTRKNRCNAKENDLTRARRQQKVMSSIKRRALSPIGFARLPLIAWHVPKTLDSDMAGPRLMGTMAGLAIGGGGKTEVLGTTTGYVPDQVRDNAVESFLGRR